MNRILCIGESLIDVICTDRGKPLQVGEHFIRKAGGAPTNVAAAIAALGGTVDLAARVGNDPFGNYLIDFMHSFGVNTRWMFKDDHHFTTLAFVSLLENGERDFQFNRGADGQLSCDDVGSIDLTDYSLVHFGSATAFLPGPLQEAYMSLFQRAQVMELFISFDPNYRHLLFRDNTQDFIEQSWRFLKNCNFFKLSDEEAILITGKETVHQAANEFFEKTKAVFAITLGNEGALLGYQNNRFVIPGIEIESVDTTGAGDAFVGAVLFQLSQRSPITEKEISTEDWKKIIFNANKAGGRTCEHLGAMEAFKQLSLKIFE